MEEHFKLETKDYLTTIKRLQVAKTTEAFKNNNFSTDFSKEENRKLSSSLTAATERDSGVSEDESYIEIDLVHKLQVVGFHHFSYISISKSISIHIVQGTVDYFFWISS